MEEQQPTPAGPVWPQDPTTPMPAQWAPQSDAAPDGQFGPYYPPTVPAQPAQQAYAPWGAPPQQPPQPARMPKAEALAVTKRLKSLLIAGSVMALGVLTALAAGHVTGVTASAGGSSSGASPTQPSVPSNSDDGGFFNQAPANGAGNGGFGVSPNAPAQQPFTSSSTS